MILFKNTNVGEALIVKEKKQYFILEKNILQNELVLEEFKKYIKYFEGSNEVHTVYEKIRFEVIFRKIENSQKSKNITSKYVKHYSKDSHLDLNCNKIDLHDEMPERFEHNYINTAEKMVYKKIKLDKDKNNDIQNHFNNENKFEDISKYETNSNNLLKSLDYNLNLGTRYLNHTMEYHDIYNNNLNQKIYNLAMLSNNILCNDRNVLKSDLSGNLKENNQILFLNPVKELTFMNKFENGSNKYDLKSEFNIKEIKNVFNDENYLINNNYLGKKCNFESKTGNYDIFTNKEILDKNINNDFNFCKPTSLFQEGNKIFNEFMNENAFKKLFIIKKMNYYV